MEKCWKSPDHGFQDVYGDLIESCFTVDGCLRASDWNCCREGSVTPVAGVSPPAAAGFAFDPIPPLGGDQREESRASGGVVGATGFD